jgi:hypothetical protein
MTVIRPNSVSGITSFTSSGNELTFYKSDGTIGTLNVNINSTSGVSTFSAGTAAAPSITPTGDPNTGIFFPAADTIAFAEGGAEAARFDSSGRLLIGTSTNIGSQSIQVGSSTGTLGLYKFANNDDAGELDLVNSRSTIIGSHTVVQNNDFLGRIFFRGSDGSAFPRGAEIACRVDGTPGANDMPGRLVFATTSDNASSPTERMRITSEGIVYIGRTSDSDAAGHTLGADGFIRVNRNGAIVGVFNRNTNDGTILELRQDGTVEGTISVSGTTVTYGGGHLARWSQLPNEGDPSDILKGTVMSNLDEMCEWGEEDNEQLNKTKVSDVEGDPNVAGVFVATSFSDDGPLDFFCAMTGDMIIRIAEGVTVQRGDLLMSAGDGTAKPQDDDIIRSKTIAKVTSTHITCTYDDGSYCVPCVLMAC